MEDVERLSRSFVEEMERLLNTKSVVGDPITVNGNTIIPLMSIGFGFGAGGGMGRPQRSNGPAEGLGGGTGGMGGIRPVALIIVNQEGVRVEPVSPRGPSTIERVAETMMKARGQQQQQGSQQQQQGMT